MLEDFQKVIKVIESCKTYMHCKAARKMLELFVKKHKNKNIEVLRHRASYKLTLKIMSITNERG